MDLGVAASSELIQSFPLRETRGSLTIAQPEGQAGDGSRQESDHKVLKLHPLGPCIGDERRVWPL